MKANERWIWLDETMTTEAVGLGVFRLYPGAWMLSYGGEALGPFDDRSILRAVRMACTPCIDGCELGGHQFGVRVLDCARRAFRREPSWQVVAVTELPESITVYDSTVREPIRGCCTTFAAMPDVLWSSEGGWKQHVDSVSARGGCLNATWNAHPAGSLIVAENDFVTGFTVIDLPRS